MRKNSKDSSKPWLNAAEGKLAIDVFQTPKFFIVQAPIAGVEEDNLDISLENEVLNIRGERPHPEIPKNSKYIYQECYWGRFSRQVSLPENIEANHIKASLEKGILTIKIPKTFAKSKKKIKISH